MQALLDAITLAQPGQDGAVAGQLHRKAGLIRREQQMRRLRQIDQLHQADQIHRAIDAEHRQLRQLKLFTQKLGQPEFPVRIADGGLEGIQFGLCGYF